MDVEEKAYSPRSIPNRNNKSPKRASRRAVRTRRGQGNNENAVESVIENNDERVVVVVSEEPHGVNEYNILELSESRIFLDNLTTQISIQEVHTRDYLLNGDEKREYFL